MKTDNKRILSDNQPNKKQGGADNDDNLGQNTGGREDSGTDSQNV